MKKIELRKIRVEKKTVFRIIILLLVAAGAVFFIWKKMTENKPASTVVEEEPAVVTRGSVQSVIAGKGTLQAKDQYEVKSLVKGDILKAPFQEGDAVKKGSLLYQISTSEINSSLNSAQLAVEKAEQSYQSLVSQQSDLKIISQDSGYVTKLYVENGDMVSAGTVIADLSDDSGMNLKLNFPSASVSGSWKGKKASVILDGSGETVNGTVIKVGRQEKTVSGGVLVREVTIQVKNSGYLEDGAMATAVVAGVESMDSGSFRVKDTGQIKARSSGEITSLSIKKEQWVKKGQTVASLASRELNDQIKSARNGIKEAQNELSAQEQQVKSYRITSPISGEVITKNKKKGDVIDPSSDSAAGPMAIIYDMSSLKVELNVDELDILKVKEGQEVRISASAVPDQQYTGTVERISLKGNTEGGVTTYPVTVGIKKYGDLIPGMNINGQIILDAAVDVLTIPSACLMRGDVVYVKDAKPENEKSNKKDSAENGGEAGETGTDGTPGGSSAPEKGGAPERSSQAGTDGTAEGGVPAGYHEVKVKTGINDGATVEIIEGLNEGDLVYLPAEASGMDGYGMGGEDEGGGGAVVIG